MADARSEWKDTGDKLTELGRKLKVHYDAQHGGEAETRATRDELTDAARRLGAAVQDAFEAIGAAARDKGVQADVKQVGQSLVEALGATLGQATDELRRAFSERKGGATSGTPSTPGTTEAEAEAGVGGPGGAADSSGSLTGEPPAAGGKGDEGTADEQPPKVEPWGTP